MSLLSQIEGALQEESCLHVNKRFSELEKFCSKNREVLKQKAIQTLEGRGCQVCLVSGGEEAANKIAEIVRSGKIVTHQDPLLEVLGLDKKLKERGLTTLCIHGEGVEQDNIDNQRVRVRQEIASVLYGLTGVQAVVANHGSLMLLDERGSLHSVSSLPLIHIAVASVKQIVPDLSEAMTVARFASLGRTDRKLIRYISIITGPSSTSDIEGKNVRGMHGPKEVYVILVDGS